MTRIAVFPGSFDPFTNGHLDTVRRAASLFDAVAIAAMTNTNKHPLFSSTEKVALIQAAVQSFGNVQVVAQPEMLTVTFAKQIGAHYLIRGLRNVADYNYEADIAAMNHQLDTQIETVLLLADKQYSYLSSSLIKEVASFGGDVSAMLPPNIDAALQAKLGAHHA